MIISIPIPHDDDTPVIIAYITNHQLLKQTNRQKENEQNEQIEQKRKNLT